MPHDGNKLVGGLREAVIASGLKDGMTISTHHSLRNGDYLLNDLVKEIDALGIRDIKIASSSVHIVHSELVPYIRKGTITGFECGVNGLIGELVSKGELDCPIIVRSHGGRARSLITGEVPVDVAFLAAPYCDEYGNFNGFYGPSACGSLVYAQVDAQHAHLVVAVTDYLAHVYGSPDAGWHGDRCGCPDDRCRDGYHHDGGDDECGCLPAVLDEMLGAGQ